MMNIMTAMMMTMMMMQDNNYDDDDDDNDDSSPGKLGEGGYQGFNVAWNTGTGFMVKGDKHIIGHNLGLDEQGGR